MAWSWRVFKFFIVQADDENIGAMIVNGAKPDDVTRISRIGTNNNMPSRQFAQVDDSPGIITRRQ
ncbi:MAG: hypothetical protein P4N60_20645 [Verrucomicrobiae bacterium]|nr:hypothetical protein [Verrucomicrobiae bacterium]